MKLFNTEDKQNLNNTSLEAYNAYLSTTNVIAQEALSDYLHKAKDKFVNLYNFITAQYTDKIVSDIVSNRFEVSHKVKNINFTNIREDITSKPENFKGKYVDYTLDLINTSNVMAEETEKTLTNLKLAIASFVTNYKEDKVDSLYGASYFNATAKYLELNRKAISAYFPTNDGSTKSTFKDIFKSMNDLSSLYKNIEILDKTINIGRVNYIAKLSKECSELIDTLIEQNMSSNINLNNNTYKKDLTNAIFIAAKEVEFFSYLYFNVISFYGSFKNNVDDLVKLSDR